MSGRLGVVAVAAASVGWGSLSATSVIALRGYGPSSMLLAEVAVATLVLVVVCRVLGRRLPRLSWSLLALGMLEPVVAFLTFNCGLRLTSSSHAGVLLGLESVFAVVLGSLVARERPAASGLAGIALGVAGVAALTWHSDGATTSGSVLGDALVLLDSLVAAAYLVLASRLVRELEPVGLTAMQFLLALPVTAVLAAVAWLTGAEPVPAQVPSTSLAAMLLTACLGIAAPFLTYTWGLRRVSVTTAAALVPITPVAAVAFSTLILGDRLTVGVLWALALIAGGLVVFAVPGRRTTNRARAAPRPETTQPCPT